MKSKICLIFSVLSLIAATAAVGQLEESAPPEPPTCNSSLSHIGLAVQGAITTDDRPGVSELTRCNQPASEDWLFYAPSEGLDFYYKRLGQRIASTRSSMEISTLNGGDRFKHLAKGIAELNERMEGSRNRPLIRVITGKSLFASWEYDILVADLPPGGPDRWNVDVAVINIGRVPFETWNHSKLSVQDECVTSSGSVEVNPASEMFMELRGDAAGAAKRYFDSVWSFYPETLYSTCKASQEEFCESSCFKDRCWEENLPPVPSCSMWSLAGRSVFSLGRGQFGEWPRSYKDLSADRGIFAALEAADEEIFILQRSFEQRSASPNYVPRLYTAIADAAVRGVTVKILIGDGERGIPPAEEVWGNLADFMEDRFVDLGLAPAQRRAAHALVSLGKVNTHAKVFMVDRQAFYVGSQNFYPSGLQDGNVISIIDLYEQGFLVDDPYLTSQMAEQADALWSQAQGTIFPNPHAWNGTYEVDFDASGSGGAGSGWCSATFQLEIHRLSIEPPYVDFLCWGEFNGNTIVVDAWLEGDLELDGSAGGMLGGSVPPYSDSTTWSGQMNEGVLSAIFSDLELGISYSGSFTATPID